MPEAQPLFSYHFDLGNSTDGPIGYCARVRARTEVEALALLKEELPEEHELTTDAYDETGAGIEYLCVYFNHEKVGVADIDDDEPVEAEEAPP